ncbi:importin-13-like [Gigantopelta aegis]|uniref:importin-13-like n=1 Tax=Gigantopelta aegis TaxID=1735272 RepID=UPI001B88A27A|nr:importin-13-like [Gigantopelta aegis]XP_041359282.1 importin-13-like [Gigantopelta aegis]
MDYSAANVEQAVLQFYCNGNLHPEVHQWLTRAQISPQAWTFCWDLVQPDKGTEIQFFGASTLHVKISRFWHEVPPDQYESLKSRLMEKILQFVNGPKLVLTRLFVSLGSFINQTAPEVWPDPIENLITTFQRQEFHNVTNIQRCKMLLEILTVIPEEFFSANLGHHRRTVLRAELNKGRDQVLPLIQSLLNSHSPTEVYEVALKCFSSWVEFGVPVNEGEQIILSVFQSLHNPQLFEIATDTLTNVFSNPDSHRYTVTMQKLLVHVLQLQDMLKKSAEGHDLETCHGLTRVIVSLAENHTKLIVDSVLNEDEQIRTRVMAFLHLVLFCTSMPGHFPVDENCSDLTFTFWYILQDEVGMVEVSKHQLLFPVFQPIYFSLMEVLVHKVQYPSETEYAGWSAEEKEQFRCYRQDIGDTMMYAFNILKEPLLGHMCNALAGFVNVKTAPVHWQMIEAIFYLFSCVAESIDLEESVYLPALLKLLPQIPFNNVQLISTTLSMIGSFGEWMNCHPENLGCIIPLILQGLGNSEVATAATMALKDVSRENLDHMQPYTGQILSACQSVLEGNTLKSRDALRLMSCAGQVLSILPFTEIMQYLEKILSPHIAELEQLVKQEPNAVNKNAILLKVNLLSWLFSSLDTERESPKPKTDTPKPVLVVLQQIMPIIQALVTKWITDEGIIEAVCEVFRKSIRTLMDDFSPVSQEVAQLTIQMYQAIPHFAILDLVRQIILLFGSDSNFEPFTKMLLSTICSKSLEIFHNIPAIREKTDVIEAFMSFLAQILKKMRHLVTNVNCNLIGLFHAGIIGMSMPEHHTVKAACSFMNEFLTAGYEVECIKEVIEAHGEHLVDRILRSIGGESSRGVMDNISDVLFLLNKFHVAHFNVWLGQMVVKDDYPSVRVTKKDKEQFVKTIIRERVNKRKVRSVIKEFSLLCRGLLGTEYAAQAAALI